MSASKPTINLLKGWPHTSLLPTSLLLSAGTTALSHAPTATAALTYAPDPGHPALRSRLAAWLTSFYRPPAAIPASRICVTGGASQSLGTLLAVYTDPGYTLGAWCVAPAYMLAFRVFDDAGLGAGLRGVPEDAGGVDVAFLRREMARVEERARAEGRLLDGPKSKPARPWNKFYRHVIYAVPTFSNPSARTMSAARRADLVRAARDFDALVVTDDVYDFLRWPASAASDTSSAATLPSPPPRLVDVDRTLSGTTHFGNAVSNGSFSKICGPGCRTGWVEGTEAFAHGLSQAGTSRSGGAPSQFASVCLAEALKAPGREAEEGGAEERGKVAGTEVSGPFGNEWYGPVGSQLGEEGTGPRAGSAAGDGARDGAQGGLQRHVADVLAPAYRRRHALLAGAVRDHLVPLGVVMAGGGGAGKGEEDDEPGNPEERSGEGNGDAPVAGGYFLWLTLPDTLPGAEVARRAREEEQLVVAQGEMFEVPGEGEGGDTDARLRFRHHLRLCFAWEDEAVLAEGVARLAKVLERMLAERGSAGQDGKGKGEAGAEKGGRTLGYF